MRKWKCTGERGRKQRKYNERITGMSNIGKIKRKKKEKHK